MSKNIRKMTEYERLRENTLNMQEIPQDAEIVDFYSLDDIINMAAPTQKKWVEYEEFESLTTQWNAKLDEFKKELEF